MDYFKLLRTGNEAGLDKYLKTHNANKEINGQTLLFWAVYENNLLFTQRLVQQGANINKKDKMGRTPLLISCYFGFYDITKLLLDNGAVVDAECFERAARGWDGHYQTEIIDLLKKHVP